MREKEAFACALRLLNRREHGAFELIQKLTLKGYGKADIEKALIKCQELQLQSDHRYSESLCHVRMNQGYGPLKIKHELQSKNINPDIIDVVLLSKQDSWASLAEMALTKKVKNKTISHFAEFQKLKQFLLYKGFPSDLVVETLENFRATLKVS